MSLLFVRECKDDVKIDDDGSITTVLTNDALSKESTSKDVSESDFEIMVIRLSMLLFATADQVNKLLFIKTAATTARTRKIAKDEMKQHDDQQQQREHEFLTLKKLLDNEIKSLVIKIGCFMNLYNLISDSKYPCTNIFNQFTLYFNSFPNDREFFYENKHKKNKETLFDAMNKRSDLSLLKSLRNYGLVDESGDSNNSGFEQVNDIMVDNVAYFYQTSDNAQQLDLSNVCYFFLFVLFCKHTQHLFCLL